MSAQAKNELLSALRIRLQGILKKDLPSIPDLSTNAVGALASWVQNALSEVKELTGGEVAEMNGAVEEFQNQLAIIEHEEFVEQSLKKSTIADKIKKLRKEQAIGQAKHKGPK